MVIDFETQETVMQEEEILLKDEKIRLGNNKRLWSKNKIKPNELPTHIIRDPLLWQIFQRLHYEDKNLLGIIVGETGAGKSCTGITIARLIDVTPLGNNEHKPNFVIKSMPNGEPAPECRVVYKATDFLRLVRSKLPKGSVIVWDEAGIGNDNTQWYDKKSQIVKHVLQSFRSKNLCLLLTVPDEESVTIGTRRLIHLIIDVKERNDTHASCQIKWLQRNRQNKKVYKKTTVFEDETGTPIKLNKYLVPKIDSKTEKEYNFIKDHVLENINKFYETEMRAMEKMEESKLEEKKDKNDFVKFDLIKAVEIIKNNKDYCFDEEKQRYDPNKIMFILNQRKIGASIANSRVVASNL